MAVGAEAGVGRFAGPIVCDMMVLRMIAITGGAGGGGGRGRED